MTKDEQKLGLEQRELVAIGASVGAGCHPCVSHHIEASRSAGLSGDRLLAATMNAERVMIQAAAWMAAHARSRIGIDAAAWAEATPLDDQLASLGAALSANDMAAIEGHLLAAAGLGVSRSQLEEAIALAGQVQENAARIHRRAAERLLQSSISPAAAGGCGSDCGCDSSPEADAACANAFSQRSLRA